MKKQFYFPRLVAQRPEWFRNFAIGLITHAGQLGLPAATLNAGVADALYCEYSTGSWLTAVRELGPSGTASIETLFYGTGPGAFVQPVFVPPPLPAAQPTATPPLPAVVPVAAGALTRIFAMVQMIKAQATYTEELGLQLGIVGAVDAAEHPIPSFTLKVERGGGCQCVKITFQKFAHDAVVVQSRRANGAWETLGIGITSPFLDERPLINAAQAETREYRLQYFEGTKPMGDVSPVQTVSVAP
jgi:hypothetical protein